MKYRGLRYIKEEDRYEWVYGMPSYGYDTEEIAEIGTQYGDFYDIDPATLGEETDYTDRKGRKIYTGDITTLKVDGEVREFVVDRATVDREYNTMPGFNGKTVKVRLSGVVVFRWIAPDGVIHQLLPCVDGKGTDDTALMEIVDMPEEEEQEQTGEVWEGFNEAADGGIIPRESETQAEDDNTPIPGQQDMSDYPEYVPDPQEKGLDFTEWIHKKYGMAQYTLIGREVRDTIKKELEENKDKPICPAEWETRLTNALSVWVMGKTKEYKEYLQG